MRAKIIGYGVSGKAAESYLVARGIETVVVADTNEKVASDYDFCVVSPGVPAEQICRENVPVVPEVELPFYCEPNLHPSCLIAVTGTNGKTTIVNQIFKMCNLAKEKTVLCGNVGIPVSRVANKINDAITVVEVSSFMLEQTRLLHPNIAVLTNITADHLDRHQNLENYRRCKAKIAAQQTRSDWLVVNYDDCNARLVGEEIEGSTSGPKVIWYSTKNVVVGYYIQNGYVWEKLKRRAKMLGTVNDLGGMAHTLSNALAVIAVGRYLGISTQIIWQACRYQQQPHRMELVADYNGVVFYNDSKATNIAATLAATRAIKIPTCLILCGLSKGQNYIELLQELPDTVKQIIVFGAIREPVMMVAKTLGLKNIVALSDLSSAVNRAIQIVQHPGVVLFSPSGSSFDQFVNYEHRGDEFRQVVLKLTGQLPQYSPPTDVNL